MFARLLLLFIVVPLVELALLIQVGQVIGLGPTILLVLVTGVAGAALARREGVRTLTAIQRELAQGRLPGRALLDGAAILVGGAFLLTPGILTDLVGISLLLPVTRRWFGDRIKGWLQRQMAAGRVQWTVVTPGMGWPGGQPTGTPFPGQEEEEPELDPRNEIDGGEGPR